MFNTLIDPKNITDFNRNKAEKELFALFCIVCAGKNSQIQAKKLSEFLGEEVKYGRFSPFEQIRYWANMGELTLRMKESKLGQYSRLFQSLAEISGWKDIDLMTVEDFESIYGIGPKTARLFFLHSYPNQRFAALDTHIMKFINKIGYPDAPKATPTNNYAYWEKIFLDFCDKAGIKDIAGFDLFLWNKHSK